MTDKEIIDYYRQVLSEIREECEHYRNAPLHFGGMYAQNSMDGIIDILQEMEDEL